jgi:hypothetical protein
MSRATPATPAPAKPGSRYCPMCEVYTSARVCKACGLDTERVPREDAAPANLDRQIVERLAQVYTVDTDQAALITLVAAAKQAVQR